MTNLTELSRKNLILWIKALGLLILSLTAVLVPLTLGWLSFTYPWIGWVLVVVVAAFATWQIRLFLKFREG